MRINNLPLQQLNTIKDANGIIEKNNPDGLSFKDFLNGAIHGVNDLQIESGKLNEALALGLTDNIHQVMIVSEKAEVALQYTMQVRNKILDAYHEIMRMPI